MANDPRQVLGARLKSAREYLGISQEEAASAANVPRSAISLIESGQRKLDSIELMSLAKLYQRPMAYFTEDDYSVELDSAAAMFARSFSELSSEDQEELQQFAEFLAMKSKKDT